jgi:hypothetical protein
MEAKTEATRREFQTQLKEVEAGAQRGEEQELRGRGEANEFRRDYMLGRVPAPVRDRSGA